MKFFANTIASAIAISLVSAAPQQQGGQQQSQAGTETVWDAVKSIQQLSTFQQACANSPVLVDIMAGNATEMSSRDNPFVRLDNLGRISVFAPINQAFEQLPPAMQRIVLDRKLSGTEMPQQQQGGGQSRASQQQGGQQQQQPPRQPIEQLQLPGRLADAILAYHMVPREVQVQNSSMDGQSYPTLLFRTNVTIWNNQSDESSQMTNFQPTMTTQLSTMGEPVQNADINDAAILYAYQMSNGYLYLIDGVISPLWYFNVTLADVPNQDLARTIRTTYLG